MKSGWVDRDAKAIVADGAKAGIDPDLSLRIYTTRLLGGDAKLVLHGGGNTSLKTEMTDLAGEAYAVMAECWDWCAGLDLTMDYRMLGPDEMGNG